LPNVSLFFFLACLKIKLIQCDKKVNHGPPVVSCTEPLGSTQCGCKGQLARVHQSCLQEWVRYKGSNRCEICARNFTGVPPPALGFGINQVDVSSSAICVALLTGNAIGLPVIFCLYMYIVYSRNAEICLKSPTLFYY